MNNMNQVFQKLNYINVYIYVSMSMTVNVAAPQLAIIGPVQVKWKYNMMITTFGYKTSTNVNYNAIQGYKLNCS